MNGVYMDFEIKWIILICLLVECVISQSGSFGSGGSDDGPPNNGSSRLWFYRNRENNRERGSSVRLRNQDRDRPDNSKTDTTLQGNLQPDRDSKRVPWQEEQLLPYNRGQGQGAKRSNDMMDRIRKEMYNRDKSLREGDQPPTSRSRPTNRGRNSDSRRPNDRYDPRDRDQSERRPGYRGQPKYSVPDRRPQNRGQSTDGRNRDEYYSGRDSYRRDSVTPPTRWRDRNTPPTRWQDRQGSRGPTPGSWDSRYRYPTTVRPPPYRPNRPRDRRPQYPTRPPYHGPSPQGGNPSSTLTGMHPFGLMDPDLPDGLDDRWQHMQAKKAFDIMNKEMGGAGTWSSSDFPPYRRPTESMLRNSKSGPSGRTKVWNSQRNQNRKAGWHDLRSTHNLPNATAENTTVSLKNITYREFYRSYPPTPPPPPLPPGGKESMARWSEYMNAMEDYRKSRSRLRNRGGNFFDRPDSIAEQRQEAMEDRRGREWEGRPPLPTSGADLLASIFKPNSTKGQSSSSKTTAKSAIAKLSDFDKSLQQILVNMNKSGADPLQQIDKALNSLLNGDPASGSHTYHPDLEKQGTPDKFTELGASPTLGFGQSPTDTKTSITQSKSNDSSKADPDNEGSQVQRGRKIWGNRGDFDPDPDAENSGSRGRSVWRYSNNDADPDPDAEDTPSGRAVWRTREGQEHLNREVMRDRYRARMRKLGDVEVEGGEVEIEGGRLRHVLRQMFRRRLMQSYMQGSSIVPDTSSVLNSINTTLRAIVSSMKNKNLSTPITETGPIYPPINSFMPVYDPGFYPYKSDFHQKTPTAVNPSPNYPRQEKIPTQPGTGSGRTKVYGTKNPIPHLGSILNPQQSETSAGNSGSLNPLLTFPSTAESSMPFQNPAEFPPISPSPMTVIKPPIIPQWRPREKPRSQTDQFETFFRKPDTVVPIATQPIPGLKTQIQSKPGILPKSSQSSAEVLTPPQSGAIKPTSSSARLSTQKNRVITDPPAKVLKSETTNDTKNIQTVTEKMVQITELVEPVVVSTSSAFGIVIGCIIGICVIAGPIACVLCRVRTRAKEREKKKRAAADQSKEEHGIMEAMIRSELGRTKQTLDGANGGPNDHSVRPKSRADNSFAKIHYELQNLKSGRKSPDIIVH